MVSIKIVEFDPPGSIGVKVQVGTWQRWWRVRSWLVTHAWLFVRRLMGTW